MKSDRRDLFVGLALLVAGVAAFFLFLYATGHDPDERRLSLLEYVIAGALVGPGFGYLVKWTKSRGRS